MKWVWLIGGGGGGGGGDLKTYRSSSSFLSLSMWTSLRQLDELLSLCSHKAKAGRYHLLSPKWPLSEPISLKTTLFLPKDYLGKL